MKSKSSVIISAVIWASVMLICSQILGELYKEIDGILLTGATLHILQINSKTKFENQSN
jgi:hypothetical protein